MTDFDPALREALSSSLGVERTRVLECWFYHNQVSISTVVDIL